MSETLYQYYRQQSVLPTYGGFRSDEDLAAHERHRRRLFTDKLFLPPRLFKNSRLLEFGPDAGENSLVFARWGAHCILAEPNQKAHPVIRDYFRRFQLEDRLASLEASDVASFPDPKSESERFDLIDAEGFIYTVKPESIWMGKFARLVRDEGMVVLFYCEAYGSLVELMLKVVQSRFRQLTGLDALQAAHRLFDAKWNSIPHKRKIESWVMDVLENPFVRLRYFFEPVSLCRQMGQAGFRLYSSWPSYHDGLDVHWFKKIRDEDEQWPLLEEFIARSRLSHVFGRTHFLTQRDRDLEKTLSNLLKLTDGLVDDFDDDDAKRAGALWARLAKKLESHRILTDGPDRAASLRTVNCFQRLLSLLRQGSPHKLVQFCTRNRAFIQSWGMPSHFAVFRKTGL
jgi:methyltransferase family protein